MIKIAVIGIEISVIISFNGITFKMYKLLCDINLAVLVKHTVNYLCHMFVICS